MIVKSLSRSSGSTGQLLNYVFRYILEKEQKEAQEKTAKTPGFSKEDVPLFQQAFEEGNLNFSTLPYLEISAYRDLIETELDSAVRIAKTTAIGKELTAREKAAGSDLKKTQLYLTPNYLVARHQSGDRFFRLSNAPQLSNTRQEPQAKDEPFIIRHNVRTKSSIQGFIKEFEKVESLRIHQRTNSVSVYHHIISFSPKDKELGTDAMLKDLAAKFISLRSPDSLFVGTKHTDKDHIHLHLAMSAVDLAGRSVRISQSKFQELKTELQRYQIERYPELSHSLPNHGGKARGIINEAVRENIKTQRPSEKASLQETLETVFTASTSLEHFLAQLEEQHYTPYYRSGTLTGVALEGQRKFRFARLGYTQEKLQSLNLFKAQEEKELAELQALRNGNTKDKTAERIASLNESQVELSKETIDTETIQDDQDIERENDVEQDRDEKESAKDDDSPSQDDDESDDRESDDADDDGRSR